METIGHTINGAEVESLSGESFQPIDPSTGQPVGTFALGSDADVDRAVRGAQQTFEAGAWRRMPPGERAAVIRRIASGIREHSHEIAEADSRCMGKPITSARAEALDAADYADYFAGLCQLPDGAIYPADPGRFVYSRREPYGVVAGIGPWNFPIGTAVVKSIPPLAVGNSVVLKMASQSPLSAVILARIAKQAGLPDGALNVVHGSGARTGIALVSHPLVRKITFTGSTAAGQEIMRIAANDVKSVHMELGGKSAHIVFSDADVAEAAHLATFAGYSNTGQICTSGSRVLVDRRIADQFVEAFVARARSLRVGIASDPATQIGPVVTRAALDRVLGYVELGRSGGARLATGGSRLTAGDLAGGYFMEPTLFTDVDPGSRIAQEEIFGPVLSMITFDDEEEAVRIANGVMYGLASMVWTNDLGRAFRMAERLDSGIVWTNCPEYVPINAPYEGRKMSGLGEDTGIEVHHTFTQLKTHYLRFGGDAEGWK